MKNWVNKGYDWVKIVQSVLDYYFGGKTIK